MRARTRSAGRLRGVELALLALTVAAGLYLAWDQLDGGEPAVASAPAPGFRYFEREDGMPVGEVDREALARFLESRGIPPLALPWPPMEAAVARRFETALRELERAPTAAAYGLVGQLFDALDLTAQASAAYGEAARLAPDDHRWHHLRGRVLALEGDLEGAERALRRAIELEPRYLASRWRLASLCAQQDRLAEAEAILRETLAASADAYPWTELAALELQRDRPAEAKALLEEALQRGGRLARAHALMSQALAQLGDFEGAERHAREGRYSIKSLDPVPDPIAQQRLAESDSVAYHRVAARSRPAASPQAAVETWERICRADPSNADDKIRLANAYFEAGRPEDAVATIEEAMAQVPLGARFRLSRAQLALRMDDAASALRHADEAIALDERVAIQHGVRAAALSALGRPEEAVLAAERMAELAPDQASSYEFLWSHYAAVGRLEEARATVLRGLELDPGSATLKQALEALERAGAGGR